MKSQKQEKLKKIVSGKKILQTSFLRESGFTSRDISALVKEGALLKITRGHYLWHEYAEGMNDMELVRFFMPGAVLCLFSAIDFYGLSTVNPSELHIALPRGTALPSLPENLFVKIYRMTEKQYKLGISEEKASSGKIKIYDKEKTVCDCFKFDKDVDKSVAIEVLKNYAAGGSCNIQRLLEYAALMGKKKIIQTYLEAIL